MEAVETSLVAYLSSPLHRQHWFQASREVRERKKEKERECEKGAEISY